LKDIVERLRAACPAQPCRRGVLNGRESAEELVGRADAALYGRSAAAATGW
jgi:hypothetical protein